MYEKNQKQTIKKLSQQGYRTRHRERMINNEEHLQAIKNLKSILKNKDNYQNGLSCDEDKEDDNVKEFTCGCGFSTLKSSFFKGHVLRDHKGRCIEGSSHFVSPITQLILPCKVKIQANTSDVPREIHWNGFVLIPNEYCDSQNRAAFYCGNCSRSFDEIVQFLYHCLHICSQLENKLSSHRIYAQEDWNKDKIQQLSKPQGLQQFEQILTNDYQITEKSNIPLDKTPQNILKLPLASASVYEAIQAFTKQLLNSDIKSSFFFIEKGRRKYYYDIDFPKIIGVINLNNNDLLTKLICGTCKHVFSNFYNFKLHILKNCHQQSLQSKFILIDKSLFLQKYKKKIAQRNRLFFFHRFPQRIDPYVLYEQLSSQTILSEEVKLFIQKNRGFVMLYFDIESKMIAPIHCQVCNFQSPNAYNFFRHLQLSSHFRREIIVNFLREGESNYRVLDSEGAFLAKETFNCSCNGLPLSKSEFVNHVINSHGSFVNFVLKF